MRLFTIFISITLPFTFILHTQSQNIVGTWKAFEKINIYGVKSFHEIKLTITSNNGMILGTLHDKILGTNHYIETEIKGNIDGDYIWLSSLNIIDKSASTEGLGKVTLKLKKTNINSLEGFITSNDLKHKLYFNEGNKLKFTKRVTNVLKPKLTASSKRKFKKKRTPSAKLPLKKTIPKTNRAKEKEVAMLTPPKKKSKVKSKNTLEKKKNNTPSPKPKSTPLKPKTTYDLTPFEPWQANTYSKKEKTMPKQKPSERKQREKSTEVEVITIKPTNIYQTQNNPKSNTNTTTDTTFFDTSNLIDQDTSMFYFPTIPVFNFNNNDKEAKKKITLKNFKKRKKYLDFSFQVEFDTLTMVLSPINIRKNYDTVSVFINNDLKGFYVSVNRKKFFSTPIIFTKPEQQVGITFVSEGEKNKTLSNTKVQIIGNDVEFQISLTPNSKVNNFINLKYVPLKHN